MAALVVVVVGLFILGRPGTPAPSGLPVAFDAAKASRDLRAIAEEYPQRVAGSDADNSLAVWIHDQLRRIGLEPRVESFPATIDGKQVALQNVWAVSPGTGSGTILMLANRDVSTVATQGANDNASGVATLLSLARTFSATAHSRSIIFLFTTGDAAGATGARRFVEDYGSDDLNAAIALRRTATRESTGISLDGWSAAPRIAPPWLWQLVPASVTRVRAKTTAHLPAIADQVIRLAVPAGSGAEAPFVAAGVPAISVSAAGAEVPPAQDTVDNVSEHTLTQISTTVVEMVNAIDATAGTGARSGGTISLTPERTLPGASLTLIFAVTLLPLGTVTVDLLAHCLRAKVRLRPAFIRAALHLAPWMLVVAIVYLANLVGLLPRSPSAIIPPDSPIAMSPLYLRALILLAVLVVAYVYAVAVERRLKRGVTTDPRATIFAAHAALLAIAVLTLLLNPYAILVVLPAAIFWPLARPGGWARSVLPVYLGLAMLPVALVYYAARLDVGWKIWWYFLVLLENHTIPAIVVLIGAVLFSTAGILAHSLHERGLPASALASSAERPARREPRAETEMAAVTEVELRRTRNRTRERQRGPLRR